MTLRMPEDELELLQKTSAGALQGALERYAIAYTRKDDAGQKRATEVLARVLAQVMAAADLFGRRRLLREVDLAAGKRVAFGLYGTDHGALAFAAELPEVPFVEAINDLLSRDVRLASGWREAQQVYAHGGFATARGATERINQRIQSILEKTLRSGESQADAERQIVFALRKGDPNGPANAYTRAYAETVFRTVVASSYSAGRMRQAEDPAVRRVMTGWRFDATRDANVRHNHLAADGFVAHMDDPVWEKIAPPLGYQCRCTLVMVPTAAMPKGLVRSDGGIAKQLTPPTGAGPDKGFVRAFRPDRQTYAGL